eukprot:760091-Pelagomonas_calceolata.AAC.1
MLHPNVDLLVMCVHMCAQGGSRCVHICACTYLHFVALGAAPAATGATHFTHWLFCVSVHMCTSSQCGGAVRCRVRVQRSPEPDPGQGHYQSGRADGDDRLAECRPAGGHCHRRPLQGPGAHVPALRRDMPLCAAPEVSAHVLEVSTHVPALSEVVHHQHIWKLDPIQLQFFPSRFATHCNNCSTAAPLGLTHKGEGEGV